MKSHTGKRWRVVPAAAGQYLNALLVAWVLLWVGAWPTPAAAVTVGGLYQTRLPVADRSPAVRDKAFSQALREVLIKVSGDSAIAGREPVRKALAHAQAYVQAYAYQDTAQGLRLQVRFEPRAIDRLLTDNGLPLWGRQRPVLIAWIGIDAGAGHRYLLGRLDSGPQARPAEVLEQAARARGLPFLLPLMDLEDRAAVRFADLAGGFLSPVMRASARYHANAVLIGVLRRQAGRWKGEWQLEFEGRRWQWEGTNDTLSAALAGTVNRAADSLAQLLAVAPAGTGDSALVIEFEGVHTLAGFARIEHLLAKAAPIRAARLQAVDGRRLEFYVLPRAGAAEVARNLDLVEWLQAVPGPAGASAAGAPALGAAPVLRYRYAPPA